MKTRTGKKVNIFKWTIDRIKVWSQPLRRGMKNRTSYIIYCSRHSLLFVLQVLSAIIFWYGIVSLVIDLLQHSFSLTNLIITLGSLAVQVVMEFLAWRERQDSKYVDSRKIDGYYSDIEPPNADWTRKIVHIVIDGRVTETGGIYSNAKVDRMLQSGADMPPMERDTRYEKDLRRRIKHGGGGFAKLYYPYLRYNLRLSQFFGRQFDNETKWGLSDELSENMDAVTIHKTCYYDSYLTNIIPGKKLLTTRQGEEICSMDQPEYAPFVTDDNGKKKLRMTGDIHMANEPGVTTLWLLNNDTIPLWQQSNQAQSNRGQVVASGSGSVDWADCKPYIGREGGFRRAVTLGMERELYEESVGKRSITKEEFFDRTKTIITGYFRWLEKAGKAEFVGVSFSRMRHIDEIVSPEESEVTRISRSIHAPTVYELKENLRELVRPATPAEREKYHLPDGDDQYISQGCNISCAAAVLSLDDFTEHEICQCCPCRGTCSAEECSKLGSAFSRISALADGHEGV